MGKGEGGRFGWSAQALCIPKRYREVWGREIEGPGNEITSISNASNLPSHKALVTWALVCRLSGMEATAIHYSGLWCMCLPQMLTTLILRENRISELPAEIGELTQLTALDVSHNNLHLLPEGEWGGGSMCIQCICVYD